MEDEAKTVESAMKEGMRRLLIRVAKRRRKVSPAKQFGQTFLKFNAWCESARGLKKIAK